MKALHTKMVETMIYDWYLAHEVYFGFMPESNTGVLAHLPNHIAIRAWLQDATVGEFRVENTRVVFYEEADATLCYLRFR